MATRRCKAYRGVLLLHAQRALLSGNARGAHPLPVYEVKRAEKRTYTISQSQWNQYQPG